MHLLELPRTNDLGRERHPPAGVNRAAHSARGSTRRLDFVDSLRGVAALYVVVYHAALLPNPTPTVPEWASAVVLNGGSAVMLFFVISAFSLCQAMRLHESQPAPLLTFFVRRFFRIAPMFYAMLAVAAVGGAFGWFARYGSMEYAKSVLFVFNLWPGSQAGIVAASWTIGVEMLFYAIFPFLFVRCRTLASAVAATFAALLLTEAAHELLQYLPLTPGARAAFYHVSAVRYLPIFLVGMVCWHVHDRWVEGRPFPRPLGWALMLGAVWSYRALSLGALNTFLVDPVHWQAVIYGTLLLGLAITPTRLLVNRFTLFAGRVSFSIYLLHPVAIGLLAPVYRWAAQLGLPATPRLALCFAATFAAVVPAAALTYRLVEAPGMRLGRRVLNQLVGGPRGRTLAVPIPRP